MMEPTSSPTDVAEEAQSCMPLITRYFTQEGQDVWSTVEWERRDARAGDFFQADVEVPKSWSDESIGVVAKLYLATVDGTKEDSIRQMIHRVVGKITDEACQMGYLCSIDQEVATKEQAQVFYDELCYICLHQIAGFNTPTWLNIGVPGRRQCGHACYPLSVQDHMLGEDSITDWWRKEAIIFKTGGGTGINLSNLRGSMEKLSTGGMASGPLPYMRAANAGAETLKSGGVHRRAAKFVCLDVDHPDIEEFIWCKVREDERMVDLMHAGHDLSIFTLKGERNVAEVTSFQSANNSVCVSDAFMRAVENDETWDLIARVDGRVVESVRARDILRKIAEAAWRCADPGVIFIDTINSWHTTPSLGAITTTNTCGEICQNDDTACNLSALNLLKFIDVAGFKTADFRHVVDVMMMAMDIVNGFSELPTERITQNTRDLRQCGLGFTNLGAAIMAGGSPYDSDEGRDLAAAATALLTGRAYYHSARMAERLGTFKHFDANRDTMLDIVDRHRSHLPERAVGLWQAVEDDWSNAASLGRQHGYRNSQMTAMMPTGTVSFLLGADTTGIEPAFNLVTYKQLAAGGQMVLVSRSAAMGARSLGYPDENVEAMARGDFSCIAEEDLPVFATAVGENAIEPMGHLRMVTAIQPFVSQSISKTTNLPNEATADEIYDLYLETWRRGVKVLSVYRDGSKATQVLSSKPKQEKLEPAREPVRKRLPRQRRSTRHKISVNTTMGTVEGYVSDGLYEDGSVGEVFLEGFGRMGGFQQNTLSAWATTVSIALQYGVPLDVLARKWVGHCDETGGMVVPEPGQPLVIRQCDSIVDYIARWLVSEHGSVDLQEELGVMTDAVKARKMGLESEAMAQSVAPLTTSSNGNGHAPSIEFAAIPCPECKAPMRRTGVCLTCSRCGQTSGCG